MAIKIEKHEHLKAVPDSDGGHFVKDECYSVLAWIVTPWCNSTEVFTQLCLEAMEKGFEPVGGTAAYAVEIDSETCCRLRQSFRLNQLHTDLVYAEDIKKFIEEWNKARYTEEGD